MATRGQLDEKTRAKVADQSSSASAATPSQLAEKSGSRGDPVQSFATSSQLEEKRRNEFTATAHQPHLSNAATSGQMAEKARNAAAGPPLPPRADSTQRFPPPPYGADDQKRSELIAEQWRSNDPRSSSTHSLVPIEASRDGRRTLLLVFVHGFMGNETSFQSFPAHLHNFLTITLAETHLVHTKIYPRYRSKKNITFSRDDFSTWLEPHEGDNTEVILLGHSMGGILGAEVVLQKPSPPVGGKPLRHRILGSLNFDTPFLGMHPGVVGAGLSSIFRPADKPSATGSEGTSINGPGSQPVSSQASIYSQGFAPSLADSDTASQLSLVQSITSPLTSPPPKDPFFNPPFVNDVRLPERTGLSNIFHFISKHSDGITSATKDLLVSHFEFGSAMADYAGLKSRYKSIRALEDIDDLSRSPGQSIPSQNRRVRFVNYYTASTGRPKPPKTPPTPVTESDDDENVPEIKDDMNGLNLNPIGGRSLSQTPSISLEDHSDGVVTPRRLEDEMIDKDSLKEQIEHLGTNSGIQEDFDEPPAMRHIESIPIEDSDDDLYNAEPSKSKDKDEPEELEELSEPIKQLKSASSEPPLPPIPDAPTEPEPIDLSLYTDKDSRKIAEKELKRVTKVYQQAVKDRESAIKDRKKLMEKREKKAQQDREKAVKAGEKQRLKEEKEKEKSLSGEEKRLAEEAKRMAAEEKRMADAAKRLAGGSPSPTPSPEVKSKAKASKATSKGKEKERQPSVAPSVKDDKPKRDKKFCMLPPKINGEIDKCWIRIYMEGVDEVGAHCGLFFPGPQYQSLVGDVGARIGKWVEDDATRRAIIAAEMDD